MNIRRANKLSEIQNTCNPGPLMRDEELDAFYESTSKARTGNDYADIIENMLIEIDNSENDFRHNLFIGHPGSGKTTELYRLQEKARQKGFLTYVVRCDYELNAADIDYIDVLFLMLEALLKELDNNGINPDEKILEDIKEYWWKEGYLEREYYRLNEVDAEGDFSAGVGIAKILKILAKIKGVLKNSNETHVKIRRDIEPRVGGLIDKIIELVEDVYGQLKEKGMRKTPFVIIDGLDKISLDQSRRIFFENGAKLVPINMHMLITFPISLRYTSEYAGISGWFTDAEVLPMIKIRDWDVRLRKYNGAYDIGKNVMKEIVLKRVAPELIEAPALDKLIDMTGGYIRDLLVCISKAAIRAQSRGDIIINMGDVSYALQQKESELSSRCDKRFFPILEEILCGEKIRTQSPEMMEMLQSGLVLEYNGVRWCDIHPLLEKWLKENGFVKEE